MTNITGFSSAASPATARIITIQRLTPMQSYQEAISGYGGVKHCLQPSPKHIIIDRDKDGKLLTREFAPEQSYDSMLKILGY